MKYEVGKTVVYVDNDLRRFGGPKLMTVVSVGRRWAGLSYGHGTNRPDLRVDVATDQVDGGAYSSPGRIWESLEEYEAHLARRDAWRVVRDLCDRSPRVPDHLSLEDLRAIAAKIAGPK